jgi:hypothetical protein
LQDSPSLITGIYSPPTILSKEKCNLSPFATYPAFKNFFNLFILTILPYIMAVLEISYGNFY